MTPDEKIHTILCSIYKKLWVIIFILAFIATILVGIFITPAIVHAESAVIAFVSAEGLKASVDSVLKNNQDTIQWVYAFDKNIPILKPAELVAVVVAEPIAPYDTIGNIKIPEGKVDSTPDGKIISYDQEYYWVVQKDGSKLWGHKSEGGKALIYWK